MEVHHNRYLVALKAGDRVILQQIYAEFSPAIIQLVTNNGGSRDDARDVFQSALVVLYERIRKGEVFLDSSFGNLLQSICQKIWSFRKRSDSTLKAPVSPDDLSDDYEEDINKEEKNQLFRKHLKLLGNKCQMLLAFFFAGHDMDIICEQMGYEGIDQTIKHKESCKNKLVAHIKGDPQFAVLAA